MGNGILSDAAYAAEGVGLIYGGYGQFVIQFIGMVLSIIWGFGISYIVFKIIDLIVKIRVPAGDEIAGLDQVEHGIRAYPEYVLSREEA
jgi:Amt family ammonium transporter